MSLKNKSVEKNKEKRKSSRASVRWHSVAATIIAAGRSSRTLWFIYFSIIDSTVNSFLCFWRAPHQLSSFFLPISSSRLHPQWPNASDARGKSTPLIMSVLRAQYRQMSSLWKKKKHLSGCFSRQREQKASKLIKCRKVKQQLVCLHLMKRHVDTHIQKLMSCNYPHEAQHLHWLCRGWLSRCPTLTLFTNMRLFCALCLYPLSKNDPHLIPVFTPKLFSLCLTQSACPHVNHRCGSKQPSTVT